jgi:chorismate mutase
MNLKEKRRKIDEIDDAILELTAGRVDVAKSLKGVQGRRERYRQGG